MNATEYKQKIERLEFLLKQFTVKGKLSKKLQSELNTISDQIADFEEQQFPFQPESLKERSNLECIKEN